MDLRIKYLWYTIVESTFGGIEVYEYDNNDEYVYQTGRLADAKAYIDISYHNQQPYMIEKLKWLNITQSGSVYEKAPADFEIQDKINEIIDYLNNQK